MGLRFAQVDQQFRTRSPVSPVSPMCFDHTPLTGSERCSVDLGVMTYWGSPNVTGGTVGTVVLDQWLTGEPTRDCHRDRRDCACNGSFQRFARRGGRGAPVFRSLQKFLELRLRPWGFA